MKAMIIGLIAFTGSFALAEGSPQMCTPGQVWEYTNSKGVTKDYVCNADGSAWNEKNPAPNRCKEGKIVWMEVYGKFQGKGALTAQAQCVNGKYRFFNDEYNYRPTRGLNKCKEGRIWVEGQDRGQGGVTYVCENGRAVRLN